MSTYYVAGVPYSSELYHHGIKGQRWGIRRFQNLDGSYTEAGRERYGFSSRKDQERMAKLVTNKRIGYSATANSLNYNKIARTPQVRKAANDLKDSASEYSKAEEAYRDAEFKYYTNKEVFNKYVNKAADNFIKNNPTWLDEAGLTRKQLVDLYREDDFDQGARSSFELYKKSNEPGAKAAREAEKRLNDASKNFFGEARNYADAFLGEYGEIPVQTAYSFGKMSAKTRLENIITQEAEYASRKSFNDKLLHPRQVK